MRILILTQWFDPEPTFKGLLFARALRDNGHEVDVITGFPNYPGGRLYQGYRMRFRRREEIDGVSVLRVPLYPSHDSSGVHRALNYVSFAISAVMIGLPLVRKPDVIYAYHPPLTVGLAAGVAGRLKRAPFVLDVQDLWPDTLASTGMVRSKAALRFVGGLCRWVYGRAAAIIVLSSGFRSALVARGVPQTKIDVIYNWADEAQLRLEHNEQIAKRMGAGERFNVVFAGTMGAAQDLGNVLEAAKLLETSDPQVQFVFVGSGIEAESLPRLADSMLVRNVLFFPRMPVAEVGQVLDAADVLLVHLADDPLFEITIPGKTQAYLSVGKPVLMVVRGDAAELVRASRGGITCEPGDPMALANSVRRFARFSPSQLEEMGRLGREFYQSELSLKEGTRRFLAVFERLVSAGVG